ncbi:YdcF family protein [Caulobacter sp. 17J65-9]|uniref:YdcF family protein n=1 Tax=Caulobacter sp. 17J65-9 TaxID=2709382 RepID=UPI0013CCBCBF|nr:YdcF family protein [Caulobacter sp. 17J65-9]NEX92114.1 YdcF family protein [Caulobacter sp. 17J65-9]
MGPSIRQGLVTLAAVAGALFAVAAAAIVADGLTDDVRRSDVAVVLGAKVYPSGRPAPNLAARLDKAVELHRGGFVRAVIVSGGFGKEGHDEATVMRRYLIAHGVPADAILVDHAGVNTMATARNAATIMRAHGFRSAVIVTEYFHVSRTRLAFEKQGLAGASTAHADWFDVRNLYSVPREVVGYAAYLVR